MLHRQPFLQGSLQVLKAALEILNFPGRATIPRPLGLLLWGNGSHITLRFGGRPCLECWKNCIRSNASFTVLAPSPSPPEKEVGVVG